MILITTDKTDPYNPVAIRTISVMRRKKREKQPFFSTQKLKGELN